MSHMTENFVVDAVVKHLEAKGSTILEVNKERDRGVDVRARVSATKIIEVEAKGSLPNKVGRPYKAALVRQHVARAIYPAMCAIENGHVGAIALPYDDLNRRAVAPIIGCLDALGVVIMWVKEDGTVLDGRDA